MINGKQLLDASVFPSKLLTSAPSLSFQPGGTAKSGQFIDWDALYEAFLLTEGLALIGVDATFAAASTHVETYDFQNRAILLSTGNNPSPAFGSQLTIPDGAQVQNLLGLTQNLQLNTQGSAKPSLVWTISDANFLVSGASAFLHSGALGAMHVSAGQSLFVTCINRTNLNNHGAVGALFSVDAGGTLAFSSFAFTNFFTDNFLSGPAGATAFFLVDSSWPAGLGSPPRNPTNPGYAGALTYILTDQAQSVSYVATAANWVAPPPTETQQAIDRMSALLFSKYGPIP